MFTSIFKKNNYSVFNSLFDTIRNTRFIFTVKTNNAGTSNNDQFIIQLLNGKTYDFTVYYDGISTTHNTDSDLTLTFPSGAGTYQIEIEGTFPSIYCHNTDDKDKIISVEQIGIVGWESFDDAFYGCSNITSFNSGICDTSNVTSMRTMFYLCSSLNSINVTNFDTSKVTNMGFLFNGCTSLNSLVGIEDFNTSNVANMSYMFSNCLSLNSINVTNFNTSNVTNMSYMFNNCNSLTSLDITNFNTSNVTSMRTMFYLCSSLTSLLGIEDINVTSLTNATNMFLSANNVLSTSQYDDILVNWEAQTVQNNVPVHFDSATFTGGEVDSGTTDGDAANKLIQSGQNFQTTVSVGDAVKNTTDTTWARVTNIDSDTQLTLDTDIMDNGENYKILSSAPAKSKAGLIIDHNWSIVDGGIS